MIVLMNRAHIEDYGPQRRRRDRSPRAAGDAVPRIVRGLRVVTYNVPEGSCAGYYPECNPVSLREVCR